MSPDDDLKLGRQIAYASADLGLNAVETILRLYLLIFYTNVVGLRPGLAGLAVALGLIFDAVTDPLMGSLSDRLQHRFGGRRFFVLSGGFLLAAGLILVFSPPQLQSEVTRFAWLLGTYMFLNLGLTVMAIPHTAMSGEISSDPHRRSVLFGWRFAFANAGALLAAALPVALDEGGGGAGVRAGIGALATVAWVVGALLVLGCFAAWIATRSLKPTGPREPSFGGIATLFAPLRSRAFRPLVAAYVVAYIGVGVNSAVALYYYGHHLELSDKQIQTILIAFMGVFTLSLGAWVQISKTFGKRKPLAVGASITGVGTTVLYLLIPPGNFVAPLVLGAIGLGAMVGCIVLIDSILTDVIDLDLLLTRRNRSGLYFGMWRFASKIARAGALATTGWVLDQVGFDAKIEPTEEVRTALMVLFGPGVGVFFLSSGLILAGYRFRGAQQARVRRLLRRRADREAASSPTGTKGAGSVEEALPPDRSGTP